MQFLSTLQFIWILIFSFSIISVSVPPALSASHLNPIRAPSTGYQPHFHVSGDKIYYVWHEYDDPSRQIFTAEMNIDGTVWRAMKKTSTPFEKYEPQFQGVEEKIHLVWRESDGSYFQIWTAVAKRDGTEWKAQKRTKSPYGKYDPQLQVVRNKIYYAWPEDHGPTEPIWIAIEILTE